MLIGARCSDVCMHAATGGMQRSALHCLTSKCNEAIVSTYSMLTTAGVLRMWLYLRYQHHRYSIQARATQLSQAFSKSHKLMQN
jgi:hypothetical protein